MTALAVVTLILSLGPNVPGFRLLIACPGFSFFRAPARWSLPCSMALAILAGKGLDGWRQWPRPGRALIGFAAVAAVWVGLIVGLIELSASVASADRSGSSAAASALRLGFQAISWSGPRGWDTVVAQARQPVPDAEVQEPP